MQFKLRKPSPSIISPVCQESLLSCSRRMVKTVIAGKIVDAEKKIRSECVVRTNVGRTIQALFENDRMGDECDQHRQSRNEHAAELIQI